MIDTQDTARKIRTDIFVHTSKESNFELGERLGLTGEALQNFKYACYEVKLSVDVDMETGDVEIVEVDDEALLKVVELPNKEERCHFLQFSEAEASTLLEAILSWDTSLYCSPLAEKHRANQEHMIRRLESFLELFAVNEACSQIAETFQPEVGKLRKRSQLMEDEAE